MAYEVAKRAMKVVASAQEAAARAQYRWRRQRAVEVVTRARAVAATTSGNGVGGDDDGAGGGGEGDGVGSNGEGGSGAVHRRWR